MKKQFNTYRFPVSGGYWKDALKELHNIRSLVICAILCAVAIVMEKFQIPIIPGILTVSFSFTVISLCSFITGPVLAIPCGIIVDSVGAMIFPTGYPFHPGYTLSAVLSALIYALFLYRAKLSFERLALAKLVINVFVNVLLGSVWRLAGGNFYLYYVALSGIKNLLMFPFEVFIMTVFIRALLPSLCRLGLCDPSLKLEVSKKKILICALAVVLCMAVLILYLTNEAAVKAAIEGFLNKMLAIVK